MGKDYYEVLGVPKDADEDQLKKGAGLCHTCDNITESCLELMRGHAEQARPLSCVCLIILGWLPRPLTAFFVMQLTGNWQ